MRKVSDLSVSGRRVLLRCDLNVPMAGGRIEVFTRTRRAIAFLGKRSSDEEARRVLEELVRRDPSIEM